LVTSIQPSIQSGGNRRTPKSDRPFPLDHLGIFFRHLL
jgi:hypothetical protein